MKKLFPILFISLFIFSCDDDNPVVPTDECGVSGGDNSTCTDECGVVNGENLCLDECGVPYGDGINECGGCGETVIILDICYTIEETTILNLSWKGLSEVPSEIIQLINLTHLYLDRNNITGEIPTWIGNLSNLGILDLDNNEFTGEIPSELGNLDLYSLNLSDNQLTGEIPPEIWNMTGLGYLRLENNYFTGEIPPDIENLTNLTELLLNDNEFSGNIPGEICNTYEHIPSWGYINISENQFCPPYPSCIMYSIGNQDTSNCPEN